MLIRSLRRPFAVLGAVVMLAAAGCTGPAVGEPSGGATPTPPPATMKPLKALSRPSGPLKLGTVPKQQGSEERDAMTYQLEKIVWTSLGVVPDRTEATCTSTNDDLLALVEGKSKTFTCAITTADEEKHGTGAKARTVVVDEVRTTFDVTATRHPSTISWTYHVTHLPVAAAKLRHEIARQAAKPARITCYDDDRTRLLRIGDPDAITCYVTHPDNSQTEYRGGLDGKGRLVFATAAQVAEDAAAREDEARKTAAEKKAAEKKAAEKKAAGK